MATTTRSRKAAATVTKTAEAEPQKRTTVTELGADWRAAFDELSEVSLKRAELEAREKQLKDAILEAVGKPTDRKHSIAIRVAGAIRMKVSLRARTNVSAKDLKEAFPEAYEACSSETEYAVLTPA